MSQPIQYQWSDGVRDGWLQKIERFGIFDMAYITHTPEDRNGFYLGVDKLVGYVPTANQQADQPPPF